MDRKVPVAFVIDDDALTREMLRDALAKAGVGSIDAVDGLDGLERLRGGFRPSVIILDMVMPRLDGPGFVRELRANPELAKLPVIAMSACPAWSENLDVNARVRKPVDFAELVRTIETLCGPATAAG